MTKIKAGIATAALMFTAAGVQGHPGHGLFDHGILHSVSSPVHLLTLAGVGIGLLVVAQLATNAKAKVALKSAGAAALVAAAALAFV